MRPRSLKRQLLLQLIAAQILLVIVAAAVFPLVSPYVSYRMIADSTVRELLLASLRRQPDGALVLRPRRKLMRYAAHRPELAYAVLDRATSRIVGGSAPELAAILRQLGPLVPRNEDGLITDRPGKPGDTVIVTSQPSTFGHLVMVTAGNRFGREDLIDFADDFMPALMPIFAPVLFCTLVVVPLVVRRALRPLSRAAAQAVKIDMCSLAQRLPESDMPAELLPLVEAINAALSRLQEGMVRQRLFMANAAHELRTPVAILQARIDALAADRASKGSLQRDLRRIRLVVEQLLMVARLGEHEVAADEPVELVARVRAVVADCAPLAIQGGRHVEYVPKVARAAVLGNARAIESAVANLIENALRAEPVGGRVSVSVDAGAVIEVVDHGPGVAPEDRERIFEPFWRKDERQPGAGLGLAIVREVARLHGGRISVAETGRGGATFRLELPEILPASALAARERQVQAMYG